MEAEKEEMDDEDLKLKSILREAFGDSSSDSDCEPLDDQIANPHSIFGDSCHIWEPVNEIKGLWICREFLSVDQQSSLLSALEEEGYLAESSHNQAMKFGNLPPWAIQLSHSIRENVILADYCAEATDMVLDEDTDGNRPFPPELLQREPLFNQLIVNIYQPCEGICAHVDLMRFEDGIAIVSLESSCVMHFSAVEAETHHPEEVKKDYVPSEKIPVLMTPGSLVLMWGEARYCWKHEINRKQPQFQTWQGHQINQGRRTSITLRRLGPDKSNTSTEVSP